MESSRSSPEDVGLENILNELRKPEGCIDLDFLLDTFMAVANYELEKTIETPSAEDFLRREEYSRAVKFINQNRMQISHFNVIEKIGVGAFGKVSLVERVATGKIYALKEMNKAMLSLSPTGLNIWNELCIMSQPKSEWLVHMHYSFQDQESLYMVLDFVQGGEFYCILENRDLDESQIKFYVAEIVLAVDYLHSLGYIHRDLKLANILVEKSGHLKLCDFGASVRMDSNGRAKCCTQLGTLDYAAPEMILGPSKETFIGRECDWWALGVIIYEMIAFVNPFEARDEKQLIENILDHKNSVKYPENLFPTPEAKNLIESLLCESTSRLGRNGADNIKGHPFFKNIDWTWGNIRDYEPPYIPPIVDHLDTSLFILNDEPDPPKISKRPPKENILIDFSFIRFTTSQCSM